MPRSRRISEFAAISQLQTIFRGASQHVELGIGDDAAVLKPKGRLVWTVDTAVEHVHFERAWLSLGDLGWRSFQAAASDVSAMAGAPIAALSSVIFPAGLSAAELNQLARGQRSAARALGCQIVGGNLSLGRELSITTTLLGEAARPVLRSGAKPGDELWLCGDLGLAAAGLRLLQRGASRSKGAAARRALRAFRRPRAQLAAGLSLARHAHAAIDISDGLAGDAAHLARASGVRLVFDVRALEATLSSALRALATLLKLSALQLALYGGEDYALLAAGPSRARPDGARVIGTVERGRGVWLAEGPRLTQAGAGFQHSSGRKRRPVGP
ncbi:MAG TPA: thiamine-phosphate kinase [Polyangiaceae bacterium]